MTSIIFYFKRFGSNLTIAYTKNLPSRNMLTYFPYWQQKNRGYDNFFGSPNFPVLF